MMVFDCLIRERFLGCYEDIADYVASHGYAVLEAWDTETSTLKEVSERFGSVQTHIRADANGLVGITTEINGQSRMGTISGLSTQVSPPTSFCRTLTAHTFTDWFAAMDITSSCFRRRCWYCSAGRALWRVAPASS